MTGAAAGMTAVAGVAGRRAETLSLDDSHQLQRSAELFLGEQFVCLHGQAER